MSLKPDDFPIVDDGSDAFIHGIVIKFDGKDEWSLYDDPPAKRPAATLDSKKPKSRTAHRKKRPK
ncbi:MAG: hypothetical protein ACJ8F7_11570 [Gemmataceae bacterium]